MLHIAGDQHSMTDIPSHSFRSERKWHFELEHDFSLGSRVCTVILTLQFWHHTNYHSILVTYPSHAVTLPSLTNLGPVARLEHAESWESLQVIGKVSSRVRITSFPGLLGPEFYNIFFISETLDKIESNSRLQCYIGDLRGIPPLGVAHSMCTLFTKAKRARFVSVALPQFSLFPLHWIAHRYHIKALHSQISWFQNFAMSSRKNGADARAKKAAQLFVVCEGNPNPTGRLSIPNVMRLRGYSGDEVVNCTLQMQERREVKNWKAMFPPQHWLYYPQPAQWSHCLWWSQRQWSRQSCRRKVMMAH